MNGSNKNKAAFPKRKRLHSSVFFFSVMTIGKLSYTFKKKKLD